MPYVVMYSKNKEAKTYQAVIESGGGEIKNALLYQLRGEALQIAAAFNKRNDDGFFYMPLPVLVGVERVLNNG